MERSGLEGPSALPSGGVQASAGLDPVLPSGLLCVRLWGLRGVVAKVRVHTDSFLLWGICGTHPPKSAAPETVYMSLCAPKLCVL